MSTAQGQSLLAAAGHLQVGFQEELGLSPTAYLRSVRLERGPPGAARPALGVPISAIAHRWGFHHLGRFAEHYQRRFGVLPYDTAAPPVSTRLASDGN